MITLQTADSALKNIYLGVLSEQLNINSNPLLATLERTSDSVVGKEVHRAVTNGFNGGIGAGTEAGGLPSVGSTQYSVLKTGLKNLYGKIEITDKAVRASSNSQGAFINLLDAEMQGLLNSGKFHLGRMLYGKGDGYITSLHGWSENSYVCTPDSMRNIMVGMHVDIYVDGTLSSDYTDVVINDWNIANGTITMSKVATDDVELASSLDMYVHNGASNELTGLDAIFDTTNVTTLYGIDRTNVSWLKPTYMYVATSYFNEAKMLEMTDYLSTNWNSNVDFIVMSYNMRRKYQELLSTNKINTDITTLAGGYTAMSFNGVPVVADRFVDTNDTYFFNTKLMKLHEMGDWDWLTDDKGRILHQKEGYPIHTATLVKYAELMCDKPAGIGKMEIH